MKTFTFQEFRDICRSEIGEQGAKSVSLRAEANNVPRVDRQSVRHHAREFRELKVDHANDPTPEKEEKLTVMREQGRLLRVQENIDNARERAKLMQARLTPRTECRRWHWAYCFARLRERNRIEQKVNGVNFELTPVTWVELCKKLGVKPTSRFKLKYKYGSIVVDGYLFAEWANNPTVIPVAFSDYINKATQAKVAESQADTRYHNNEPEHVPQVQTVSVVAA